MCYDAQNDGFGEEIGLAQREGVRLRALRAAFPHTVPIMAAFLFVGVTYGMMMRVAGFGFVYPMAMSAAIFGGSVEFVVAELLQGAFLPLQAFLLTLMLNARHLFYGMAMLERYRGLGPKKWYMIFGLCDETFAVNCSVRIPEDVDAGWFMFCVTLLDQLYWVAGATMGGLLGALIPLSVKGLGFAMTAMFIAIFLDHWRQEREHVSSALGVVLTLICLLLFGANGFLLPAMAAILLALTLLRGPLEKRGGGRA